MSEIADNGPDRRDVVVEGRALCVTFAVRSDGSRPAATFLEGCSNSDQAKLIALFERMAEHGRIHHPEKFKKLKDDIWEFKSFQIRMPCFRDGQEWVLTHGFTKKKNKTPKSEIQRAIDIMNEDLAR